MRNTFKYWLARATTLAFMMMAIFGPAIALAQRPAPAPVLKRVPAVWVGYLLIALLLGIVMSISLLPSKRSHQD